MNSGLFKKLLPHLIAIIVFLIITAIFCKPVLDGNVLNQIDIVGWKGSAQNAFEYKAKHGHFPLWNPNVFSGMPNYQISMQGKSILPDFTKIMSLGLPKPMNFFFLACICFYILCLAFGTKPVIGILGGLAYAFATYNPIIIGVGHESKMMAIAFMPLLLAGIILTFEKKYWIGLAVTTLGAYLEIAVNHPQINYYFLLIALAVTIGYLVRWIKQKEWTHIAIAGSIVVGAALIGAASSAITLLTSYEYTKTTMRGGKNISIEGGKVKQTKTSGLDKDYAFQYSMDIPEPLVMMVPRMYGGSSDHQEVKEEKSKTLENLQQLGQQNINQIAQQTGIYLPNYMGAYWGGIGGTSGPPYSGAIICFLSILAFFILDNKHKWWILATIALSVIMAWGSYFKGFNYFLFDHLPLYNKFRAPSMILVIPQLLLPITACLGLNEIINTTDKKTLLPKFKKGIIATGIIFAIIFLLYFTSSFLSKPDLTLSKAVRGANQPELYNIIKSFFDALKEDRKALMIGDIFRSLGFIAIALIMIFLFLKNKINYLVLTITLIVFALIDVLLIDKTYLNADNYISPDELSSQNFTPTVIDQQIMQDKDPDFRVFNTRQDWNQEGQTTYFHKSIGGYHPAKLRIYQDLIDRYLLTSPNQNILNMLNTKYIIFNNPQTNKQQLQPNPYAYGPCWLVKNVKLVNDAVEEIQLLGNTNLRDTALVQKTYNSAVTQPLWDSAATIKLAKFDNDTMDYSFNSSRPQFAVFSEVYYPYGWNAYLDGKKVEYCKADYVLRGLSIPAGQHAVKFIFEPSSYKKGVKISYAASFLILILFLGGLFMEWRSKSRGKSN